MKGIDRDDMASVFILRADVGVVFILGIKSLSCDNIGFQRLNKCQKDSTVKDKLDYLHQHIYLKCKTNGKMFSKSKFAFFPPCNIINILSSIVFCFYFRVVIYFFAFYFAFYLLFSMLLFLGC